MWPGGASRPSGGRWTRHIPAGQLQCPLAPVLCKLWLKEFRVSLHARVCLSLSLLLLGRVSLRGTERGKRSSSRRTCGGPKLVHFRVRTS